MTPDEQHAWEVIKALAEKRRVAYLTSRKHWHAIEDDNWDKFDVRDIIKNPKFYEVSGEEQQ